MWRKTVTVTEQLSKRGVNRLLNGVNSQWITSSGSSKLTMKNYEDLKQSLSAARKYVVQFECGTVSTEYKGMKYSFEYEYRDPWEWITSLVTDPSLASVSVWHSMRKYYCNSGTGVTEQLIDEPWTADTWWSIDDELPPTACPYPHCYLPLHFWLDKGLVTRRVKKFPMILRAAWLPRQIRNASGNGGGVLVGYMPIIKDPEDPTGRNHRETVEFQQFRRTVYQKVLAHVFKSLRRRSWLGETLKCGDSQIRTLYPDMLILSLDGEEAANFCACRATLANYPCPKCLVDKAHLHRLSGSFEPRTSASMTNVIHKARAASSNHAKEKILMGHGLHDINHFLWWFRFGEPYKAISYDTLHSDDLGKWQHHLWDLLLQVLEEMGRKGRLTAHMSEFPRWPDLKHFDDVTTEQYTDGNSFLDILKCILPCIVQLFPANAPLIWCIRSYIKYRLMVGMRCMPESRLKKFLKKLKEYVSDYERSCERVTLQHGKNFNFPKQHATSHAPTDIRQKGTTDNYSTRPGEGFQQEAAEAYAQTNGKEAEHQMSAIDETQEAIARIRMAVDKADEVQSRRMAEDDDELEDDAPANGEGMVDEGSPNGNLCHWSFGAPAGGWTNSRLWEERASDHDQFRSFDSRLRTFLASALPDEPLPCEAPIQSREDWTAARDIVRCNPLFHNRSRYDSVLINMDSPELAFGRLCALLRCRVTSGKCVDIAVVRMFTRSAWKPNTLWDGCRIYEELRETTFVMMDYIARGALLSPIFGQGKKSIHCLVDTTDPDMFLRAVE
ncbi:hypothetical protein OE88DRAFT_1774381 [Heliocybe sulcata]|uniref:Uncharacterized protein n=1 Tax=Heliocybe sulcata TaxID=5364 RepID=A0A5C3MZU4_9AGAM|nr:hypothetical protein OE88DRAFT_1774381 [Heliocybe sulcata]